MAEQGEKRRLAEIFAADMVGYSRLMEADERGTLMARLGRTTFDDTAPARYCAAAVSSNVVRPIS